MTDSYLELDNGQDSPRIDMADENHPLGATERADTRRLAKLYESAFTPAIQISVHSTSTRPRQSRHPFIQHIRREYTSVQPTCFVINPSYISSPFIPHCQLSALCDKQAAARHARHAELDGNRTQCTVHILSKDGLTLKRQRTFTNSRIFQLPVAIDSLEEMEMARDVPGDYLGEMEDFKWSFDSANSLED